MNIYPSNFSSPFKPTSLEDFVISDDVSRSQLEAVVNGRLPFPLFGKNAICIWGVNGSGKTTLAEMLPQLLDQSANLIGSQRKAGVFEAKRFWDLTECAIGMNSVTMLADLNKRCKSMTALSSSGWHYEILDEVDNLTPAAQASLKTAITFANSTIFILTTNHPSKLDKGILDRSLLLEMNQPKPAECVPLAIRFLKQMGLTGNEVPTSTIEKIAKASNGSLRDFGTGIATLGIGCGGVINGC